jgi:hypothetical protein
MTDKFDICMLVSPIHHAQLQLQPDVGIAAYLDNGAVQRQTAMSSLFALVPRAASIAKGGEPPLTAAITKACIAGRTCRWPNVRHSGRPAKYVDFPVDRTGWHLFNGFAKKTQRCSNCSNKTSS